MRVPPRTAELPVPGEIGADAPLEEGDVLGRFVIVKLLGQGSGGSVYAAWDSHLGRRLALKVFDSRGADADKGWRRLIHEAQLIARLDHPNVVTVHDVGAIDGRAFIAMELVDGHDLAHVLTENWDRSPRPSWIDRIAALLKAGEGLAAAHAGRVIHGDFKPANVLVGEDDRVKVSDFGIGLLHEGTPDTDTERLCATGGHGTDSAEVTLAGNLWGTPLYMAPELFQGQTPTTASDIYSFCASLYQALYGEPPARGNGLMGLFTAKLEPQPGKADVRIPRRVRDLVMRGLDPNPARRPRSVARIVGAIRKLQRRRSRRSVIAGSMVVALAAGTGAWALSDVADPCRTASTGLRGVWDGARRSDVIAAFATTGLPHAPTEAGRVSRQLDHYAKQWVDARVETCELTQHGEQSTLLEDRKMACLDQRRVELDAFVKVLGQADASVVQEAPAAAAHLSSVAHCLDRTAYLAAPLPSEAADVDRLRSELARARGLRLAGRPADAAPLTSAALHETATLDYPPVRAEALRQHGLTLRALGQLAGAEQSLTDAVWIAEGAKADLVAAKASLDVLRLLVLELGRPKEALAWAPHVEVAIRRAALSPTFEAQFFLARGQAEADLFHHDAAMRDYEAAEGKIAALDRDERLLGAALANSRALVHSARGEHELAAQELEGITEIYEAAFGRRHPQVARSLDNTAATYAAAQDFHKALELEDEALSIAIETEGPDRVTTLTVMANRAGIFVELERYDDAIDMFHEALSGHIRALGPDHPQTAGIHLNLAGVLGMAERFDEAAEAATKGRIILEERFGPEHAWVGYALVNEGSARVERGELQLAIALLERANAILDAASGQPAKLASAQYALAKALRRADVQRPRAIALMRKALATFDAHNIDHPDIRAALRAAEAVD